MKKHYAIYFVLLVAVLFGSPIPRDGENGAYNTVTHLAYCRTRTACIHEIGHALDQRSGWISQSEEFHQAVQVYLVVELKNYLFQQAEGDPARVPDGLRAFYDWDAAADLIEMLNDSQRLYWTG